MPIQWGVDHTARLVAAVATGPVSRTDVETYLDSLVREATLSYRKVFDMSECRLALSTDDMRAIGQRIRGHESMGPMGRVAVIAGSDELFEQARQFEAIIVAERPLQVFRDAAAAYDWLTAGLPEGGELSATRRIGALSTRA
jgi:hypothetical protein